jgi:uroporphyrin-3 C-methyltransferase
MTMTEQNNEQQKKLKTGRSHWVNTGIFFSTLAVIIVIVAFGYGYFALSKMNVDLAQMVSDLTQQNVRQKQDITAIQTSLSDLQQITQKSQALSAQQEQFISEWRSAQKGDLNKWHITEAQYLVKLADDQLQFSRNIQLAALLLQEADKILAGMQDGSVNEIRKSLATDLLNLQAAPKVDITALYLRLTALNNLIDKLPLPFNPLKADGDSPLPAANTSELPWWKAGLVYSWDALRKIVIVRKNESNTLPLVMPDEKIFLYQNLHAQMEDAMWGLLHHHEAVYKASLVRAAAWVKQYFVQDAAESRAALQEIEALQKENIEPAAMNLSHSLQLFDQYHTQGKI